MTQPPRAPRAAASPPEHVQVGSVVGTHSYDGRLRIQPESDNPGRFRPGSVLTIAGAEYTVAGVRPHSGGVLLVKVEGLDSKEEASELLHAPVLVPVAEVPAPPEDTYYHYQLLDMAVVTESGEELGTITEILTTGANDVYVVTSTESERMVPALGDVVLDVDVAGARMTVAIPEGLLPRPLTVKPKNKPPRRRRRPKPKAS